MIEIASTSWISISIFDDLHFNVRVSASARFSIPSFFSFLSSLSFLSLSLPFLSFPFLSFLFLFLSFSLSLPFLSFPFSSFPFSFSCLSLLFPPITSTSGPKSRRHPPLFPLRSRRYTAVSSVCHPPASSTALAAGKSSWLKAAAREKL